LFFAKKQKKHQNIFFRQSLIFWIKIPSHVRKKSTGKAVNPAWFEAKSVGHNWSISAEKPISEGYQEDTWPVLLDEDGQ